MACEKASFGRKKAHRRARELKNQTSDLWRAYECPDCGSWHLTTAPKRVDLPPRRPRGSKGRRPEPGETLEDLARRMREERTGEPAAE